MKPEVEQRTLVHILDVVVRVTDVQFAFTNDDIALALLPAFMVVPGLVIELVESKTECPENFISNYSHLKGRSTRNFPQKKLLGERKFNSGALEGMLLMEGCKKKTVHRNGKIYCELKIIQKIAQ